jgi:hypothetical protein
MPSDAASFFSSDPEQREKAVYVSGGSDELIKLAKAALQSGDLSRADFARSFPDHTIGGYLTANELRIFAPKSLFKNFLTALFSVLPLTAVLIISITLISRDTIHNSDVATLGIIFTTIGMFALNLGLSGGILAISSQTGSSLKRTYRETPLVNKTITVKGVDADSFFTVPGENGPETYIWIPGEKGPAPERFVPEQLNGNQYAHIPLRKAMFSDFGLPGSYMVVMVIVFLLGFFAIFAEPGLMVTAVTVEEITIGTFKRSKLILIAAIGVGCGMAVGFARVLFSNLLPSGGIHLSWILAPSYALALILTIFAPEDFSSIAWDVAGIATGPIAVPIIITTGLGLGRDSLRADGAFGIVATASVFPIIVILISGILEEIKSKRAIRNN